MTRHAAYALRAGKPARHPFASFPHADAARRWVVAHPDTPVRFVPALPDDDDDDDDGHPDYAWEAEYRAHSSSITGVYEANE